LLILDLVFHLSFLIIHLNFAVTTGGRLWCWISGSASWTGWCSQWWSCWHRWWRKRRRWWRRRGSWWWRCWWRWCSRGVASRLFTSQEEEGQRWWSWWGRRRWSSIHKAIQEAPLTTHHYKLCHVHVLWWLPSIGSRETSEF